MACCHHRRPKTLQWHEKALGLFQHYLLIEHQCVLLDQITEAAVRGWLALLPQMPTARGSLRSTSTVESYALGSGLLPMVGASSVPASHAFCAPAPSLGGKPFASSA